MKAIFFDVLPVAPIAEAKLVGSEQYIIIRFNIDKMSELKRELRMQ